MSRTAALHRKARLAPLAGIVVLAAIFGSGTLVEKGAGPRPAPGHVTGAAPDPAAAARADWDTRIRPYLDARAVGFPVLQAAFARGLAAAGARYGRPDGGGDSRWHVATRLAGTVQRVALDAVVPVLYADVDGDGRPDAILQCGPVFDGTSLRDRLDFVSFAVFDNQIAYGEYGTALNDLAYATVTRARCAEARPGRALDVLGTYTADRQGGLPVITPVRFDWREAR